MPRLQNSAQLLAKLRQLMQDTALLQKAGTTINGRPLEAYIIPSADAHGSEYLNETNKRRHFISGFTGSAGTALVTKSGEALLWTDGRYFLQASDQLDSSCWQLMRDGLPDTPTL